jgi:hypothetical protein
VDEQLIDRVTQAIQNPGAIIHRDHDRELKERWSARAVLRLLDLGLLASPRPPSVVGYMAAALLAFATGLGIGAVFL